MAKKKIKAHKSFLKGVVVWYSSKKGHGRIRSLKGNKTTWLFKSELRGWKRDPIKGDEVEYSLIQTRGNHRAIKVTLTGSKTWVEGVVKKLDPKKGFGFIELIDGREVFFRIATAKKSGVRLQNVRRDCMISLIVGPSRRGHPGGEAVDLSLV